MKDYWFCISEILKTSLHGDATPHNITLQGKRTKKWREPKCCVNDTMRDGGVAPPVTAARRTRPCREHLNVTFIREKSHTIQPKRVGVSCRSNPTSKIGYIQKAPTVKERCWRFSLNVWSGHLNLPSERDREETAPLKRAVMKPMKSSERSGFQKQLQQFKRNLFTMETQSNCYRELRRNVEINERLLHSHTKQFTFQLFISSKTSNPSRRCLLCCCM